MQWLCSQLCYVTAANQWTVVEIELLPIVGWKWGCLSAADVPKMWHTAERRFVRHVCLRNPFLPFLLGIPSIHSLREASGSWEPQHTLPARHYSCFMLAKDPIPLSKIPDLCHMQKSIGLVMELWSPRFVTEYWNVFFFPFAMLLATVGWKWGCQPLSCVCSPNVMRRKELFSTCLSRESILRKSKHGGSWEGHYAPPGLHYGCIMPIPSLQLQKKPVLYREAEGLVAELWSPGLFKEYSDLRCFYVTTAKQWIILEIEHLTTVGWKWGCQPLSCPCSQNVITVGAKKRFVLHACLH